MLIKFDTPQNLNGEELVAELKAVNVIVNGRPAIDANKDLWLDIDSDDEAKTAAVVAAHNGTIVAPEPSVTEKLASVGLSVNDLKSALGL